MLTHADFLANARERTEAVTYALPIVTQTAAAAGLLLPNLALSEWPMQRILCLNDGIERMLIEVSISLWTLPTELLRWAEALGADKVRCKRRRGVDVCLHVTHIDTTFGLRWQINGSTRWPERGQMPGIEAPWRRDRHERITDDGVMTVPELRTTLTALGYPTGEITA